MGLSKRRDFLGSGKDGELVKKVPRVAPSEEFSIMRERSQRAGKEGLPGGTLNLM